MLPAQPNQSLMDGLACLQAVAGSSQPIGVRELARQLGLEATRVNRLLKTLAYLGMTQQDDKKKYHPGSGIHVLAAQSIYGSGLLRHAAGPLEELGHQGLIVALGVLWRDQVSYLYHASPGMRSVEAVGRVGLYAATESGIGMALLARQTDRDIRVLYHGRAIAGFPEGITSLLKTLQQIRGQGYAEVWVKPRTLSLGVALPTPLAAAIAFSGGIEPANIPTLVNQLRKAAELTAKRI